MTIKLKQKIKSMIKINGPISVTDYFALCLADPEHGYYKTRDPFGANGDFTTAPEISQLFGEMLGIYLIQAWQLQNPDNEIRLVEIGPGRGTLMADALRVIQKLAPQLYQSLTIHMVETSPHLTRRQQQTLSQHNDKISWHQTFEDVPSGFTLLMANELFDAIPIRQFVKTEFGFKERMVTIDQDEQLSFAAGPASIDPSLLPHDPKSEPLGTIFEISQMRSDIMAAIAQRLVNHGGSALIIDYGFLARNYGDTLQAVYKHEFDPPLNNPGEADLTSHVDFETLMYDAHAAGAHIHGLMHQGDFLVGLGLLQRAGILGRDKDADTQNAIRTAVERLAGEGSGNMGELFKVLAISGTKFQIAPFIAANKDEAAH